MVVVAVAGGTGGLGRTLLDAIAKVLSRTVSPPMLCLSGNNVKITRFRQQLPLQPTNRDVLLSTCLWPFSVMAE